MRKPAFFISASCLLGLFIASAATAEETFNIWPGIAPGSESWTLQESVQPGPMGGSTVYNVVTPTLTVYLPEKSRATGTGVIIAPGGAFRFLAIDSEGHDVARWLQEKGIAGFVLKYRVLQMQPGTMPMGPGRETTAPESGTAAPEGQGRGSGDDVSALNLDETGKYGMADGIQAVKVVRQRATEWGISMDRVGIMGFSAGAMVTAAALLQEDIASRPNFAAPIYGGPLGEMPSIPDKLPPIFLAWAQDDSLGSRVLKFYEALTAAGHKPEVHIYSSGGHGFGTGKKGTTTEHWLDAFYYWLEAQGFTKPAK